MRRYSDYKNEITATELYDGLVGYGLFAEKIPKFLRSDDFLVYSKTLSFPINTKPKDFIRYSSMRNINIPRPLAIPEPFAYANHCKSLADNWQNIQNHFAINTIRDTYKISRIHIRKLHGKPELFEMNYKNFSKDGEPEQEIVIKSKYIANADISNCFPSIYSHAIAWALVGKNHAKQNRNKGLWFNQIDCFTMNVKYGETNGILIGPHASNLISEIILVSIDNELTQKGYKYIRNIDDYSCFVDSYEEADRFFIDLSEELKKFELTLNNKKSKITPLPQASVKNWITKLNHFNFTNTYIVNNKEAIRVKELKGFLDFAIEIMLEENDASVLNYAIKILAGKFLGVNAKDYYIKQIHHLVLIYPYLVTLLEEFVFENHHIDQAEIKSISKDLYELGIKKKSYEANTYSIYWALKYSFNLDINTIKTDSLASSDCLFMLISYLYDKRHNDSSYIIDYIDEARRLRNCDFDRYWLFIYELLNERDLVNEFKLMKQNGITFIRPEYR